MVQKWILTVGMMILLVLMPGMVLAEEAAEEDLSELEWTFYQDYEFEFEFYYPADWEVEYDYAGVRATTIFKDLEGGYEGNDYQVFTIVTMPNQGGLTLEDWWGEQEAQGSLYEKTAETEIAGLEAYQLEPATATEAGPRYIFMTLPGEGGDIYDISTTGLSDELIDEILVDFEFMTCRDEYFDCSISEMPCCEGLTEVSLSVEEDGECMTASCGSICVLQGDGVCGENESTCNSPDDCAPAVWDVVEEEAYMTSCVEEAVADMTEILAEDYCQCTLDIIQETYSSSEEVMQMPMGELLQIAAECIQQNVTAFMDVDYTNANFDAISYVREEEIVSGYSDGNYKPDNSINRAEFTKIIVGAVYTPEEIESCIFEAEFPDVATDQWFAPYVCMASNEGVIGGYPDGTFKPGNKINFAEASKIIVKGFGYDIVQRDVWYEPFVEALSSRKAIPTTIESFGYNITRGEMAEMIYRLKEGVTEVDYLELEEGKLNQGTNIFSLEDIKAGDEVAGMEVLSMEPFNEKYNMGVPVRELSESNVSIEFGGEVTLTGEYYYANSDMVLDQHCFGSLDEISIKKLPQLSSDKRPIWFCFENKEQVERILGGKDGMATIVIDRYILNIYPSEIFSKARFKDVISVENSSN